MLSWLLFPVQDPRPWNDVTYIHGGELSLLSETFLNAGGLYFNISYAHFVW